MELWPTRHNKSHLDVQLYYISPLQMNLGIQIQLGRSDMCSFRARSTQLELRRRDKVNLLTVKSLELFLPCALKSQPSLNANDKHN